MKLHYYPDTDSLFSEFGSAPSAETRELQDGINIDFDHDGRIVGLDIDNASVILDLSTLDVVALPVVKPKVEGFPAALP